MKIISLNTIKLSKIYIQILLNQIINKISVVQFALMNSQMIIKYNPYYANILFILYVFINGYFWIKLVQIADNLFKKIEIFFFMNIIMNI